MPSRFRFGPLRMRIEAPLTGSLPLISAGIAAAYSTMPGMRKRKRRSGSASGSANLGGGLAGGRRRARFELGEDVVERGALGGGERGGDLCLGRQHQRHDLAIGGQAFG